MTKCPLLKKLALPSTILILLFLVSCAQNNEPTNDLSAIGKNYSFIVAGHAYGSHRGTNVGLYPKFIDHLKNNIKKDSFLVLNGDIVRNSTPQAWNTVLKQVNEFNRPIFFVMGNHDVSGHANKVFHDEFGGTVYSFQIQKQLFVILNTQQQRGSVPPGQIKFLKEELARSKNIEHVFVFIHELIWTAHQPQYAHVKHNYGSYNSVFRSNFWPEVAPIFKDFSDLEFYIIAGDVGGNQGVIPAYFEDLGNIHLLATGMGEVQDENYLRVIMDGSPRFELIPLNKVNTLKPLEQYTPESLLPSNHTKSTK